MMRLDAPLRVATIVSMQLELSATPRRRSRARSERARRARTTRELMRRLVRDARLLCTPFALRYRKLEAERSGVTSRYGVCFSDGTIKIRLYHATTGRPLKYSSLIDTLCHELAHLRHFNHGPGFQELYERLLAYARREGIYRPGPAPGSRAAAPPRHRQTPPFARGTGQLTLFGKDDGALSRRFAGRSLRECSGLREPGS